MKLKNMLSQTEYNHYHEETLKKHISDVLTNMATNIELCELLVYFYVSRLSAAKNTAAHDNF